MTIDPAIAGILSTLGAYVGPAISEAVSSLGSIPEIIKTAGSVTKDLALRVASDLPERATEYAIDDGITNQWDNITSGSLLDTQTLAVSFGRSQSQAIAVDLLPAIASYFFGKGFRSPIRSMTKSSEWGIKVAGLTLKSTAYVARKTTYKVAKKYAHWL